MRPIRTMLVCPTALLIATLTSTFAAAPASGGHEAGPTHNSHEPTLLVSGLGSGSGSVVGPDGALYVAEPAAGEVVRINPRTGFKSVFATGLPTRLPGFPVGGVTDVAFIGHTAYALVSVVGPDAGGTATVGLYRIDSPTTFTVVADIGAWSTAHPPETPFFVPSGVQYALQEWRGGFLVTDGHHNRVLQVRTNGSISQVIAFGNVVPTGLDIGHDRVYLAQAGPVPHDPATGKVVSFVPGAATAQDVAAGASILTDVELSDDRRGHGHRTGLHADRGYGGHHGHHHGTRVFAISNGTYSGDPEGSPGLPDTGSLVEADGHGGFDLVAGELDRPTSLEIIHGSAYVVTWDGEVWVVHLG